MIETTNDTETIMVATPCTYDNPVDVFWMTTAPAICRAHGVPNGNRPGLHAFPQCSNPKHDHRGQIEAAENGTGHDTGKDDLVCGDCAEPIHYDYGDEAYHHSDPGARPCFMIHDDALAPVLADPVEGRFLTAAEQDQIAATGSLR